jgi:hypothetical protein
MSKEEVAVGWGLWEALFETASDKLRKDLAAAKEALRDAKQVRCVTPSWLTENGDLFEDQEASVEVGRCEQVLERCHLNLKCEYIGKLASGRLVAKASFRTPGAVPERISKQLWPYIKIICWDPPEAEVLGEDGKAHRLYGIMVFPSAASEQTGSTAKAEHDCFAWIMREIVPIPKGKRQPRDTYKRIVMEKLCGLSGRGFRRAWDKARAQPGVDLSYPGPRNRNTANRCTK